MEIPYSDFMLPLLQLIQDKQEHNLPDLIKKLGEQFQLSEAEKNELLASGKQTRFKNRIGWAKTYLKKAGLLDSPSRGKIIITTRGLEVLQQNIDNIDVKFLAQFPEFTEFYPVKNKEKEKITATVLNSEETPIESLEKSYQEIRELLASELLDNVLNASSQFFERLVVELLVKMGYGGSLKDAGEAIGRSHDEGIDGIIKEDKLGLDAIYIQAKRWGKNATVGRPELQKFVGALAGNNAKKGIFITTSTFTKEARNYTTFNEIKIVLIDGEELAQFMIDYNVGCSVQQTYEIKKIDNDYFDEE